MNNLTLDFCELLCHFGDDHTHEFVSPAYKTRANTKTYHEDPPTIVLAFESNPKHAPPDLANYRCLLSCGQTPSFAVT